MNSRRLMWCFPSVHNQLKILHSNLGLCRVEYENCSSQSIVTAGSAMGQKQSLILILRLLTPELLFASVIVLNAATVNFAVLRLFPQVRRRGLVAVSIAGRTPNES